MEEDVREQLLNQYYINNGREDVKGLYSSPKEMLADLIAGEDITRHSCSDRKMGFKISYFKQAPTRLEEVYQPNLPRHYLSSHVSPYTTCYLTSYKDYDSLLYRKSDEEKYANSHMEYYPSPFTVAHDGVYCYPSFFDGKEKDGTSAEAREFVENRLTYDGYCVLLGMLSDEQLIRYSDSITQGINNEAKSSLEQASSVEELKCIQEDFLQLKAASEYLINNAQVNIEIQQSDAYDEILAEQ